MILPMCVGPAEGLFPPSTDVATSANLLVASTPATGSVLVGGTRRYKMEIRNQTNAVMNAAGTFTVQWSIVGNPGIATITQSGSSLDAESSGLATCLTAGTVTVRGVRTTLSADATLICIAPPADLPVTMAVVVTSMPATGTVPAGATRQYAIEVRNAANTVIPGLTTASWTIVGTAGVASITPTGGLATCIRDGSVTVRAVGPTNFVGTALTGDIALQCGPPPSVATTMTLLVTSVPATGTVLNGATRQYAIEVRDQFNVVLTAFTTATWSIVGTAGIATTNQTGLATCVSAGTITVRAVGPVSGSGTNLTADASLQCVAPLGNVATRIVLTPWTVTAPVGGTATTTATFLDAAGLVTNNGCAVTFTVDGGAAPIGTVSSSGLTATVTGSTAGRTALRASCASGGTLRSTARLQVTQAPLHVASISFETRFRHFPTSGQASTFRFVPTARTASGMAVIGQMVTFTATVTAGGATGPQVTTDQMGNVTVGATASAGGPASRGGGRLTASAGGQTEFAFFTFGDAGTIRGQATSMLGQYFGGTTVRATNSATGAVVPGDWDGDGFFYFVGLAAGTFTIVVTPVNDPPTTIANVMVVAGQETVVTVAPFPLRASP